MKIYFYGCNYDPISVPHECAVLAEGLAALGHQCFGEIDKLRETADGSPVIHASDSMAEADVIIMDSIINIAADSEQELQKISSIAHTTPIVFIDESDGLRTPGFGKNARSCALVLKSHFNRKMKYPRNFVPWQFGISNRMVEAINPIPVKERNETISVNFRVKHQLRDHMNSLTLPILKKYLEIDTKTDSNKPEEFSANDQFLFHQARGRHNPFYYQRLPHSLFVAAYGGVFCLPFGNHDKYSAKICRTVNHILPLFKYDRVRQWDSWRFWESMLAGCITIHVDLEKFGCEMPVMPVNYQDYVGIDPYHPEIFRDWFQTAMEEWKQGKPKILESMSASAREFVLKNYSSPVVADRFLKLLESIR